MPASLQKIFRTLGDPTRLRILALLEREELAVQELMEVLGMAQSRVSRHLGILREAGLVRDRRDGTFVLYQLALPPGGPWRAAWEVAAGDLRRDPAAERDRAALARVLEARSARSRSFFDAIGPEWEALRKVWSDDLLRARAVARLVPPGLRVLDLGTGTGAIIISILAERPRAVGLGTDVSAAALAVAQSNAERHAVLSRLKFVRGNWFEGISGPFDLIVSNPPYIPAADIAGLAPEVRVHDPRPALCGGADGLDAYRQIAAGARCHLAADGRVAVEIGAGQEKDVEALFSKAGMKISGQRRDLAGRLRVLTFRSR
jgi:release factor glutamine methyltransferase